jgi:hypothetical protein
MKIPPELQKKLISRKGYQSSLSRTELLDVIREYEMRQRETTAVSDAIQRRRKLLDRMPDIQPPLELVVVSGAPPQQAQVPAQPIQTTAP